MIQEATPAQRVIFMSTPAYTSSGTLLNLPHYYCNSVYFPW
jgi:hypothetical protein